MRHFFPAGPVSGPLAGLFVWGQSCPTYIGRRVSPDRFVGTIDNGNQDRTCRRKEWRRILGKAGRGKASQQATSAKGRSKVDSQGIRREWRGNGRKYPFGLPGRRGQAEDRTLTSIVDP
jgi:hypothetical protein